ncbi:MerR family transcriptional regulator [Rhizobium sp. Root708]|uniref:MerR family transcriptional regulator n=1 Tax=Rhizobium sp. Root708 TaxID=1736592 RepID=UPI0006F789BB|nr:MerR family transcriptional regulator [Rhizobium sp. Root708]KRB60012.1 MerR family transcriptional regulator [Rhizobium sp. Root708]
MFISEVASIAEMSKDGIRHYEELGLITSTPVQAGSRIYRDYDTSVLKTIEQVRQAQQLGMSLKEIAPLLKVYGDKALSDAETVAFLEDRKRIIRQRISDLRKIEKFIDTKIEHYKSNAG